MTGDSYQSGKGRLADNPGVIVSTTQFAKGFGFDGLAPGAAIR